MSTKFAGCTHVMLRASCLLPRAKSFQTPKSLRFGFRSDQRLSSVAAFRQLAASSTDPSHQFDAGWLLLKRFSHTNVNELVLSTEKRKAKGMPQPKDLEKSGMPTWLVKTVYEELKRTHPSLLSVKVDEVVKPKIEFYHVKEGNGRGKGGWKCQITVYYPSCMAFEAVCSTKKKAQDKACTKVVNMLREKLIISQNFKPILNIKERQKVADKQYGLLEVRPLPSIVRGYMDNFLKDFEARVSPIIEKLSKSECSSALPLVDIEDFDNDVNQWNIDDGKAHLANENGDDFGNINGVSSSSDVLDVLLGRPLRCPSDIEKTIRNVRLERFLRTRESQLGDSKYQKYLDTIQNLPIYALRDSIVKTIEENQVTIIAGETACGKTTQIPLFVFEDFIRRGKGAECSMVITQPRRLPAISVAEQVAYQFGEKTVGNSIGYHVRFDKVPPSRSDGGILFCTAGILLKKMERNKNLEGITHLFIDEAHERDVIVDMLLTLSKRVLNRNKQIKVILMSASINAGLFAEYFQGSVTIDIKGRLFPVQKYYLPEVLEKMGRRSEVVFPSRNLKIDKTLIRDVILNVHKSEKDNGAILCFLPGWSDIAAVKTELESISFNDTRKLMIVPVHSMLPHSQQKLIFENPPPGFRKVVLATNIAETSITVPDVVHVIDPGLCRGVFYDKMYNVSKLGTHWISSANAVQREGRAGRVQAGYCYKLYTKDTQQNSMSAFPIPEMLRIPLETVVMWSKIYHPMESAEKFLSESIQPPSQQALRAAVNTLMDIGVLDDQENLTLIGKKISGFTSHPRLSVALFTAALFGCLDNVANTVAMLSNTRSVFDCSPEDRSVAKEIKSKFANGSPSDHVALSAILKQYEEARVFEQRTFCNENLLHGPSLKTASETKRSLLQQLNEDSVLGSVLRNLNSNSMSQSVPLFHAALLSAFYPNVLRLVFGKEERGKIRKTTANIDVNTGRNVRIVGDSVVDRKPTDPSYCAVGNFLGFAFYYSSFFSEDSYMLTVRDLTVVSPLSVLLFAGRNWSENPAPDGSSWVSLDDNRFLRFKINQEDALLIKKWKIAVSKFSLWYLISSQQSAIDKSDFDVVMESLRSFLCISHQAIEANQNTHTSYP